MEGEADRLLAGGVLLQAQARPSDQRFSPAWTDIGPPNGYHQKLSINGSVRKSSRLSASCSSDLDRIAGRVRREKLLQHALRLPPAMTECIIILALLSLLVATDPEPGVPFITPRQETFLTIPRLIHR